MYLCNYSSGAEFVYWSAGCAKCGVAIPICIALNAFHQMTTYKWYESDRRIESNPYPILYTSRSGEYRCVMEVGDDEKIHKFSVLGKSHEM